MAIRNPTTHDRVGRRHAMERGGVLGAACAPCGCGVAPEIVRALRMAGNENAARGRAPKRRGSIDESPGRCS